MVKLTITSNEAGQRLDRFLRKYLRRATLGTIYKLIRKDVKVNGKREKEDLILREGDTVQIYIPQQRLAELSVPVKEKTARKQFKVVYEDGNVLAVHKPKGLLVHGDLREKKNTLVNQVCGYLQEKGEFDPSKERTSRPSPAGRLDRNTTGLVMFGKNAAALRGLTEAMRNRGWLDKYYLAAAWGTVRGPFTVEGNMERDREKNISSAADPGAGKEAVTEVFPVIAGERFSIVKIKLITGRTHQIRLHMAEAGFPLAGDPKYGRNDANEYMREKFGINVQQLHAWRMEAVRLPHPLEYLLGKTFEAPPPAIFSQLEEYIAKER